MRLQDGFVFGTVHSGFGFNGDEVQEIGPNLYFSGLCDPAVLEEIKGLATEMLSMQFGASVVSAVETLGALLGSCHSSFLVGGIDFSGTHLLALGGGSKVGTAKPYNYTTIGLGAETALAVLIARFLPGMSVKDAKSAVMQALFRVIVESNDSTLNGSVFIIGLDSLVLSLNCVFRHGRGDSSKEFFFLSDIPGEGTAATDAAGSDATQEEGKV
ncbi:uncharacterized protein LOC133722910 [Rosa rugosa]|uniref:uncharacterized protein LOC133722910 n=1 Tax=Rosa rugosa TaxID=74645 RepID=UPI002B406EC1|nr:uncharacterized protein LOC133722910 [Rosa rugosa]